LRDTSLYINPLLCALTRSSSNWVRDKTADKKRGRELELCILIKARSFFVLL